MGYKIKEIREQRGMTQEELASASGVSRATICTLESEKNAITTTKTLVKLASALNVGINDIFFVNSSN